MIQRRIELKEIDKISVSTNSPQFVIHIGKEYSDYRFNSDDRDHIIETIVKYKEQRMNNKIFKIYFYEKSNLAQFQIYEGDNVEKTRKFLGSNFMKAFSYDKLKQYNEAQQRNKQQFNEQYLEKRKKMGEFKKITLLSYSTFGKIVLFKSKEDSKEIAFKIIQRTSIKSKEINQNIANEISILQICQENEFVVNLRYVIPTNHKICIGVDYYPGGELYQHLQLWKNKKENKNLGFKEDQAKFYAAQIFLALKFLHQNQIIYRDMKLENIVMYADGYIALSDFGKSLLKSKGEGKQIIGSLYYQAPEVWESQFYSEASDWWAFGIVIYELLIGNPPFTNQSKDKQTFLQLLELHIRKQNLKNAFPKNIPLTNHAKDLITKLLDKNHQTRIGAEGIEKHPWFKSINWEDIENKTYDPEYTPDKNLRVVYFNTKKYKKNIKKDQLTNEEKRQLIANSSNFVYIEQSFHDKEANPIKEIDEIDQKIRKHETKIYELLKERNQKMQQLEKQSKIKVQRMKINQQLTSQQLGLDRKITLGTFLKDNKFYKGKFDYYCKSGEHCTEKIQKKISIDNSQSELVDNEKQ